MTERMQVMTDKRTLPTVESLVELASVNQQPCLSLYQPTHRHHPENQQDPIRFHNLVKELEASLRQEYPDVDVQLLLEPFEALAHDHDFWDHTLDGLAVLGGPSLFRVFQLQRPLAELAVVADSFHTKPLRRFLQSAGRYHILGLSLRNIRLFEGDRNVLDEIDPGPGVPRTITEALGDELTAPHAARSTPANMMIDATLPIAASLTNTKARAHPVLHSAALRTTRASVSCFYS